MPTPKKDAETTDSNPDSLALMKIVKHATNDEAATTPWYGRRSKGGGTKLVVERYVYRRCNSPYTVDRNSHTAPKTGGGAARHRPP